MGSLAMASKGTTEFEFLGKGYFGRVYHDKSKNTAVKKIDKCHHDAEREAQRMTLCQHPRIIKVIRQYYHKTTLCIEMEFADQGTLKTFISKLPGDHIYFKEWSIWRIMSHLASALDYMHSFKPECILHQNLKPDNVLGVTYDCQVEKGKRVQWKLADFGIAKLLNEAAQDQVHAQRSACVRDASYIAPEVLDSRGQFGKAADVWALGSLITNNCNRGENIFSSDRDVRQWNGLRAVDLRTGNYSSDLLQILSRMMKPTPTSRPTAAEIVKECTAERQEAG